MTREELFASLNSGTKWDVGVSINRNNPLPLDASSIFESYEALETYAQTSPIAYIGQICTVISETEVAAYQVGAVGTGATVKKLAATTASGDFGTDIANLQTKVGQLETAIGNATSGLVKDVTDLKAADAEQDTAINGLEIAVADLAGAQANIIEEVKVNGTALEVVEKAVNIDLQAYALKTDLTSIPKFAVTVVESLASVTAPSTATVYLVQKTTGSEEQNIYEEYIYVDNSWEKIGDTKINLTGYYTKDEVDTELGNYIKPTAVDTKINDALANYSTTTEVEKKITDAVAAVDHNSYATTEALNKAKTDLQNAIDDKVSKADGQRLMTEAEGTKLQNIEEGAQENFIKTVDTAAFGVDESGNLTLKPVAATNMTGLKEWVTANRSETDGLLSLEEENKLNGIEAGAQKNYITQVDTNEFNVVVTEGEDFGKLSLVQVPKSKVEGLETLESTVGTLSGNVSNLQEIVGNADKGLVQSVNILTASVGTLNDTTIPGINARLDNIEGLLTWKNL